MSRSIAALSCLLLAGSGPALAAGQIDGTWKADTATAKLSTKPDVFVVKDGVYDCTSCAPPYKIAADGQPHPVAGRDYWDAASVTVLDAKTLEWKRYRKGAPVSTTKVAASSDGSMFSFTSVSADNASGKPVSSTSMSKRVGTAPVGGHATSGSWVAINDGAQIAEENLTATITTKGQTITLKLGTGEHYTAVLNGPKVSFVGDKAGAMVALTKAGAGFVETDYIGGKAVGTYTYMPVNATTMTMKAVNLKAGTTDEFTLKKQ